MTDAYQKNSNKNVISRPLFLAFAFFNVFSYFPKYNKMLFTKLSINNK